MAFISSGTTILDAGAFSASLGSQVLIKEITASSDASISFVHGTADVVLDSTYPIYKFEFINCHPATDNVNFQFNFSTDSGSNYNVTKTSTYIYTEHGENGAGAALGYNSSLDLSQSTSYQPLMSNVGADSDQGVSGYINLFNPSSTTFIKHFTSRMSHNASNDYSYSTLVDGYGNTTSAIDAVRFQMSSGNIDAGKIKLYGIKDS
jgi:hypothetical protein